MKCHKCGYNPSGYECPGCQTFLPFARPPGSEAPNVVMATALQMCRNWTANDIALYESNGGHDIAAILKHRLEIIDAGLATIPNSGNNTKSGDQ